MVKPDDQATYPFHIPNIYPDTVPKVDHPTSGGKETKNTHSHKTKNAIFDFSQSWATGASQMNTFPVKIINPKPRPMASNAANTAPTLCQKFIFCHAFSIRRDVDVARLIIWSRREVAFRVVRAEFRRLPEGLRHGGWISLNEGEVSDGEVERERARAVDM